MIGWVMSVEPTSSRRPIWRAVMKSYACCAESESSWRLADSGKSFPALSMPSW